LGESGPLPAGADFLVAPGFLPSACGSQPSGAYTGTGVKAGEAAPGRRLFIAVAVPTCNRPDDIARLLASLARVRYPHWELMIIDQSDGDETQLLAAAWGAVIPRIVYRRLEPKNASAARNLAIENTSGDVLAFIDDDCTVHPDWLAQVSDAFDLDPYAGVIFGAVTAADHDPSTAFVPTNDVRRMRRFRGSPGVLQVRAMGASMSIRLRPGQRLHFDLLLGPGARFRGSQDGDYAYRARLAGEIVVETPTVVVTHHGARSYAGGAATLKVRDYLYGAGAAHAKLLRCGEWIIFVAIIGRLVESIAAIRPQNALRHRPTRVGGLLMFLQGLRDGLEMPIDRREKLYRVMGPDPALSPMRTPSRDISPSRDGFLHGLLAGRKIDSIP
jgi:glycosyltransferase involved in cell wall biosynthesis